MSAKPSKKSAKKSSPAPAATPVTTERPAAADAPAPAPVSAAASTPWIESSDPKKRMWGKIALIAIWLYVAALWLLALDQTFHWGLFGPKVPPVPY